MCRVMASGPMQDIIPQVSSFEDHLLTQHTVCSWTLRLAYPLDLVTTQVTKKV
jgi:hypothetical protein